jgi:MFS family permease
LPDVADTINSTDFIGFLGSVYLLAFGLTYPILIRLHILLADLSNYRALIFLRLASITIFAAGSVLSYCLTTIQGAMVGRAITGMGAASTLSGITTLLEVYISGTNQRLGVFFLMVHSAARLVGPM